VKLEFDIGSKDQFWTVEVWVAEPREPLPDEVHFREYLEEVQYQRIADWCSSTFHTQNRPLRARRMSYDTFWFSSKRDLDWFILHWSGVDSTAF
jgi:hypothetical protein